ncbi:hypothetical protein SARC_01583 [Sphaeroforma arctica JP610]|uniref:Uncharacterized protein n=1 Tax=Sphaeroforma arctica JP610 TaxID=667725 RepID=A0A0L0GBI9_9EUKA|nr:hypothetical protein SARC_01583 [Sphaeroforma arctica JP610]KNC86261.1 hypothetical protein SARC_01583 [Sphaeroforma arctica JP610]|eukprot:XP_014160163.1 hypothetical protein SARC_01583 [Sphaeroforma arctica JP610]
MQLKPILSKTQMKSGDVSALPVTELPAIETVESDGVPRFWQIAVRGNTYFTTSWKQDGNKVVHAPVTVTGKNIGRSNKTSPRQQVILEAQRKWDQKQPSSRCWPRNWSRAASHTPSTCPRSSTACACSASATRE